MSVALRVYKTLARAFPHEFKMAYGADVLLLGEDVVEDIARARGTLGLIQLVLDIAMRVPLEYLSEMQRDARYAWRALIKSPGFALVGIISIGIGIGLTTMLYDSRWQLISRPLPGAANTEQLVMPEKPVSYYDIQQFRDQTRLFAGVAALQTAVRFNVLLWRRVRQTATRLRPARFARLLSRARSAGAGGPRAERRVGQAGRCTGRGDQRSLLAHAPRRVA
jgi:hypothetical protein